ncbi:hypothetical protein DV707_14710 (plasmid) [Halobellus limi]|uniref:Uncharacterized protein n=1 Tax=Halobellus limi TaxID=699433 RepID=A0A4D6H5Y2_9EURY|nr:hypothetical protein DV707_14710 [Halobellus limi]
MLCARVPDSIRPYYQFRILFLKLINLASNGSIHLFTIGEEKAGLQSTGDRNSDHVAADQTAI